MAIRIGTTEITTIGKIKLGTTNITKVYQGVNQIWPVGSTIEYEYYANAGGYQYSTIYFNGGSDFNEDFSRVKSQTTLSPAAQTISVEAYDSTSVGVAIYYYINGVYQTLYSTSTYISTGNISTSSGNAYRFIIYTGGIS
jgi:hypothetical protein